MVAAICDIVTGYAARRTGNFLGLLHRKTGRATPVPERVLWYGMMMLAKRSALERILRPAEGDMPPEMARRVLEMKFDAADVARYRELSEQAQSGQLGESERAELEDLLTTNDVLTIFHAKARTSLSNHTSAA